MIGRLERAPRKGVARADRGPAIRRLGVAPRPARRSSGRDEDPGLDGASIEHAVARPSAASVDDIRALQRVAGNRATADLVERGAAHRASPVQRDEWGAQYKTRRARPGALPYDEYKARIGQPGEAESFAPPLQAASDWGGHRVTPVALTRQELGRILLPEKPNDPDALAAHEQRLDAYLPDINAAFEIMAIDTVEAQADYLAHAGGESGTLARLSEVGAEKRPYAPFQG